MGHGTKKENSAQKHQRTVKQIKTKKEVPSASRIKLNPHVRNGPRGFRHRPRSNLYRRHLKPRPVRVSSRHALRRHPIHKGIQPQMSQFLIHVAKHGWDFLYVNGPESVDLFLESVARTSAEHLLSGHESERDHAFESAWWVFACWGEGGQSFCALNYLGGT